jgi:hypothetical protein
MILATRTETSGSCFFLATHRAAEPFLPVPRSEFLPA